MLPVIWTDDDAESDCKSYFNLYTFVVFLAWIGKLFSSNLDFLSSGVLGPYLSYSEVTSRRRGLMHDTTHFGLLLLDPQFFIYFSKRLLMI